MVIAYNNGRNINIILSNVIPPYLALKIKLSKKPTGRRQFTLSAYCIFLVSYLAYTSAMKTEAEFSSETSIYL
jgi:hypothetical protein